MGFRKILTEKEIIEGTIFWNEDQDQYLREVIPNTLVFDLHIDGREYANLSVEWEKRRLFVGEALSSLLPETEISLVRSKDRPTVVEGKILGPKQTIVIRKRLSHHEHKQRYLKWYAREDELYKRLFPAEGNFIIEVGGKRIKGRAPDFEKRKLMIGEAIRIYTPGDDLLLHWDTKGDIPILRITKEVLENHSSFDSGTPIRALIARLLSRPLGDFNEGELKGLIVLLEENKKLWERISEYQEENKRLKEQVNMLESVFAQFAANSFFNSKKEFEAWAYSHISSFEKGIRVIHRDYTVVLNDGKKRRVDLICQDKKGTLVAVEILFSPEMGQLTDSLNLLEELKDNIEQFGKELTGGQLKAAEIRGMIITNHEKTDLVEYCLQRGVKLCMVNSGCVIDILE
jgi:hypothetical protein